ncbi:MAG: hypothetical protein ACE5LU_19320, partial [Anaerolineae bacterium]
TGHAGPKTGLGAFAAQALVWPSLAKLEQVMYNHYNVRCVPRHNRRGVCFVALRDHLAVTVWERHSALFFMG